MKALALVLKLALGSTAAPADCGDAETMRAAAACEVRQNRAEEAAAHVQVVRARAGLTPTQAALLDQVAVAARRLIEAEGQRVYQDYGDDDSRNSAAFLHRQAVRKAFIEYLTVWVTRRSFPIAKGHRAERANMMNGLYRGKLDAADVESRRKTRETQRGWIRYRDAFARLVGALHPPASLEAERAVRGVLTEDRADELLNDRRIETMDPVVVQ